MNDLHCIGRYQLRSAEGVGAWKGMAIASVIISLWMIDLIASLSLDLTKTPLWQIGSLVLFQSFLSTGLFITAHDAMHRSLVPHHVQLNDRIGTIACFLYLFFPYKKLLKNHWLHHRHPASAMDPDFHDEHTAHPVLWYFSFIQRYFGWSQLIGISIVYWTAVCVIHIPIANLVLFWILPSVISSLQLFYFGTFLPHRERPEGYENLHRARSNSLPTFLSFLTCYHFGYHQEHHEYPSASWWQLPEVRRLNRNSLNTPN